MQNSAVIIKVEYKFNEADAFSEISITPYSGNLTEQTNTSNAGVQFDFNAQFEIAKNQSSTEEPVKMLLKRRAIYRLTDGNQTTYTVGSDEVGARLKLTRTVAGQPGAKNNRKMVITWLSSTGAVIT